MNVKKLKASSIINFFIFTDVSISYFKRSLNVNMTFSVPRLILELILDLFSREQTAKRDIQTVAEVITSNKIRSPFTNETKLIPAVVLFAFDDATV